MTPLAAAREALHWRKAARAEGIDQAEVRVRLARADEWQALAVCGMHPHGCAAADLAEKGRGQRS